MAVFEVDDSDHSYRIAIFAIDYLIEGLGNAFL